MQFMLRTHNDSEWMWISYFKMVLELAVSVVLAELVFDWPSNDDFVTIYHTFRVM